MQATDTAPASSSVFVRLRRSRFVRLAVPIVALAAIAVPFTFLQPQPASAHCDSRNGPVVNAARQALEARDVNLILPYVKADQEQALRAAFDQTLAIRNRGSQVQAVADEYFFETAVRLHRVGEGASYTGIKETVEPNPALDAAEAALEDGKADEVIDLLDEHLGAKVADRFQGVLDARSEEKAHPSVETSRERVEAELMFEKYIIEIQTAIDAAASHEAEGATTGHDH